MKVFPTDSYSIELPSEIHVDHDSTISSYWMKEGDLLLQLSSYKRFEGEQISAFKRLQQRFPTLPTKNINLENISIQNCKDSAAASFVDEFNTKWFYCYAVWPNVTLFITISGMPELFSNQNDLWPFKVLNTIEITNNSAT